MDNINSFISQIETAKEIAILTHVNPDGDTLGTALGLKYLINNNFKKDAIVVLNGEIPAIYNFLPEIKAAVHNSEVDKSKQFDLAIAIDIAAKDRMGYSMGIFDNAKSTINIDHHITNNAYAAFNYIDGGASSAGEVLYNMVKKAELKINELAATCLYTAICTDTGNFRHSNTTPNVLKIAGELAELGAKPYEISYFVYSCKPKEMVLLTAHCVDKAVLLNNGKIAYTTVTREDFDKFGAKSEHTEGIVEMLKEIETTDVAILFKEIKPEQIKISLRSKNIDSSKIAEKFGGGGHKFASGCTINKPLKIAIEKIVEEIKVYL